MRFFLPNRESDLYLHYHKLIKIINTPKKFCNNKFLRVVSLTVFVKINNKQVNTEIPPHTTDNEGPRVQTDAG